MRVEIQHILGLSDGDYNEYLIDCKKEGIIPLKLVRDLTREEYEERFSHVPPTLPFSCDDADEKYTKHVEDEMIEYTTEFLSRRLTDEERKMYDRTRLSILDYYKQKALQQQYAQQQQVQYVPSPATSNSGSNWLGQSIGESVAGFDF